MADFDNDDDDEWGTAELPDFDNAIQRTNENRQDKDDTIDDGGDQYWKEQPLEKENNLTANQQQQQQNVAAVQQEEEEEEEEEGEPMLLVDMTELSDSKIHCRFDPNAVNDPVAVKELRRTIEASYESYATSANLLASRTVVPCGSTVWRPALQTLRTERPGHYYCPIFPPKKRDAKQK